MASQTFPNNPAYLRDDTGNAFMQKEEERKKDGSKVIEVRRQPNTGQGGDRRNRDRGPRNSLDRNGPDKSTGRGASHHSLLMAPGLVRSVMAFSRGVPFVQGGHSLPDKRRIQRLRY